MASKNKFKTVRGMVNNGLYEVFTDRECTIMDEFKHNGETWYELYDARTGETFKSPSRVWSIIK